MHHTFLAAMFCLFQPAPADIVGKQFEAEFEELLKAENRSQVLRLRSAAAALDRPDPNPWANWNNPFPIRQARSRPAVLLILRSLHEKGSANPERFQEHVNTLIILTGEDVPKILRQARIFNEAKAAAFLRQEWWQLNKGKITTDIGRMSPAQVELIVDRLVTKAESSLYRPDGRGDEVIDKLATLSGESEREGWREFCAEDLHPAMVPVMLALAGYSPKGPAVNRDTHRIPYVAIPMLAHLRNDGEAPELDKIADDKTQNSAVRLTCVLALHVAGEDVRTKAVLEILAAEKLFERRQVAIWLLRHARDNNLVVPALVPLLDDPNAKIRRAALQSLVGRAPRQSLPRLKQLLDESKWPSTELRIIAVMQTRESNQVLADYLSACLKDPARGKQVYQAFGAFETGTGRRWHEAGAHDDAFYREKSLLALKWWEMNRNAK